MAKREFSCIQKILMFVEAVILLPLISILSWFIPYNKIYQVTSKIGFCLAQLNPVKRTIIDKNLKIIFPEKIFEKKELQHIYSIITAYELRIMLEMIAFIRMDFQTLISYIRIEQHNQVSKMYHQQNCFVGFTLHYGNWELLGSLINSIDIALACLVERQFNPWMDKYLQYLRKKMGIPVIYNEISQMKPLFKYMTAGKGVALVADQTYWFDPLFIPFFNKEASVPQGTASLAIKTKSELIFGVMPYKGQGIYNLYLDAELLKNTERSVESLMKSVYSLYEKVIKDDVTNWYSLGTDRWGLTKESLKEWEKNPDSTRF